MKKKATAKADDKNLNKATAPAKKAATKAQKSAEEDIEDDIAPEEDEDLFEDDELGTDDSLLSGDKDFEEFDLPPSKTKSPTGAKSKGEDYEIDEEFRDFFGGDKPGRGASDDDDDF
jgi:hypothetical protein